MWESTTRTVLIGTVCDTCFEYICYHLRLVCIQFSCNAATCRYKGRLPK